MIETLLNMIVFRAYNLCLGCATPSLPGQMPIEITIRKSAVEMVDLIKQFCWLSPPLNGLARRSAGQRSDAPPSSYENDCYWTRESHLGR